MKKNKKTNNKPDRFSFQSNFLLEKTYSLFSVGSVV